MRYNLLEIVQLLLSAMDSDDVDDINDTAESTQVSLLVKNVYYDLAVELELPQLDGVFRLTETSASTPTTFTMPSTAVRIDWLRYNTIDSGETYPNWANMTYLPWDTFLDHVNDLRDMTTGVGSYSLTNNSQTWTLLYRTDIQPTYFTSVDDYYVILDAVDTDVETYLRATKSMCSGSVYPTFTLSNSFEPDLNPAQFSYFINRCKVRAFAELKQAPNQEAASETRNQKIRYQRNKRIVPDRTEFDKLPKYGRI